MIARIWLVVVSVICMLRDSEEGGHFKRSHGVIELSPNNFQLVLARHKKLLVYFYDPTCQTDHCAHSYHDFLSSVRTHLKECPSTYGIPFSNQDKNLDFAAADLTLFKNKTLVSAVSHLPAIVYFFRGHMVPYIHEMSRSALGHWLQRQTQRSNVDEWHDVDELRKHLGSHL